MYHRYKHMNAVTTGLLAVGGFVALTLPYSGWRDWCYIMTLMPDTFDKAIHSTPVAVPTAVVLWAYCVTAFVWSVKESE